MPPGLPPLHLRSALTVAPAVAAGLVFPYLDPKRGDSHFNCTSGDSGGDSNGSGSYLLADGGWSGLEGGGGSVGSLVLTAHPDGARTAATGGGGSGDHE